MAKCKHEFTSPVDLQKGNVRCVKCHGVFTHVTWLQQLEESIKHLERHVGILTKKVAYFAESDNNAIDSMTTRLSQLESRMEIFQMNVMDAVTEDVTEDLAGQELVEVEKPKPTPKKKTEEKRKSK